MKISAFAVMMMLLMILPRGASATTAMASMADCPHASGGAAVINLAQLPATDDPHANHHISVSLDGINAEELPCNSCDHACKIGCVTAGAGTSLPVRTATFSPINVSTHIVPISRGFALPTRHVSIWRPPILN